MTPEETFALVMIAVPAILMLSVVRLIGRSSGEYVVVWYPRDTADPHPLRRFWTLRSAAIWAADHCRRMELTDRWGVMRNGETILWVGKDRKAFLHSRAPRGGGGAGQPQVA